MRCTGDKAKNTNFTLAAKLRMDQTKPFLCPPLAISLATPFFKIIKVSPKILSTPSLPMVLFSEHTET